MHLATVADPRLQPCITHQVGCELIGEAETCRDVQIAARLAWRKYGAVHFTEVSLSAIHELLSRGATDDALNFCAEAIREHDAQSQ